MGGGKTEIGGGRPGRTNVVRTTDGKWPLTSEYWGGGANTRYVLADNPLESYRGSATGGSPVVIRFVEVDLGRSKGAYHRW